jgi:hypothetical protein
MTRAEMIDEAVRTVASDGLGLLWREYWPGHNGRGPYPGPITELTETSRKRVVREFRRIEANQFWADPEFPRKHTAAPNPKKV